MSIMEVQLEEVAETTVSAESATTAMLWENMMNGGGIDLQIRVENMLAQSRKYAERTGIDDVSLVYDVLGEECQAMFMVWLTDCLGLVC